MTQSSIQSHFHKSVLVKEVLTGLAPQEGFRYIDATLGGGGHTESLVGRGAAVLGIDQDTDALEYAQARLNTFCTEHGIPQGRVQIKHGNFSDMKSIAREADFENVDGVLFDLGVSTYQIKQSGRGFSFAREEPLDMRMNQDSESMSALDILKSYSEDELYEIFAVYGEEQLARPIARAIIHARTRNLLENSRQLAELISSVYAREHRGSMIHPATKAFQAIRIAVNAELTILPQALHDAITLLKSGGRIAVISFHSLEDRIVKRTFQKESLMLINKKPIVADNNEVLDNPASRSAKLRIAQKL